MNNRRWVNDRRAGRRPVDGDDELGLGDDLSADGGDRCESRQRSALLAHRPGQFQFVAGHDLNAVTMQVEAASHIDREDKQKGLFHWVTPHGNFWAPTSTMVPFLLSEQINRFYGDGVRRVQRGDIVLDCGANIGAFTWEALSAGASLIVAGAYGHSRFRELILGGVTQYLVTQSARCVLLSH